MDLQWVKKNVVNAWGTSPTFGDFLRQLELIYSAKLPRFLKVEERAVALRYPPPIGLVRLHLRANGGADLFILSEIFHHRYYDVPLAAPPATILDLGANIGLSAIYFSRKYQNARVACAEPIPDNLRLLKENVATNGIRADIFEAAVDVADGEIVMELCANDYGHKVSNVPAGATTATVRSVSVPTMLRELSWERIGLLKVDIEGHEKVLLAANCDWLNRVDAMCIECHDGFGAADLAQLSARYGFEPPRQLPGIWFMARPGLAKAS